ncbi:hypothetical protein Cgig2_007716 [Carnegiea gigantea]|uniref:Uncharacterized protein n=1 Tax=Carnegiea gigantea TaxID=171969 RepID=A0A9Q1QES2_9CARY|nr:hypothetical protein Cgig2_007716 [Carnegiea gigantea]
MKKGRVAMARRAEAIWAPQGNNFQRDQGAFCNSFPKALDTLSILDELKSMPLSISNFLPACAWVHLQSGPYHPPSQQYHGRAHAEEVRTVTNLALFEGMRSGIHAGSDSQFRAVPHYTRLQSSKSSPVGLWHHFLKPKEEHRISSCFRDVSSGIHSGTESN